MMLLPVGYLRCYDTQLPEPPASKKASKPRSGCPSPASKDRLGPSAAWHTTRSAHPSPLTLGYGTKFSHQGTAGFSPWFHLPGFHFGYPFLTHSHFNLKVKGLKTLITRMSRSRRRTEKLPKSEFLIQRKRHSRASATMQQATTRCLKLRVRMLSTSVADLVCHKFVMASVQI